MLTHLEWVRLEKNDQILQHQFCLIYWKKMEKRFTRDISER